MGSPHYARIRSQVLDVVSRVPEGALTTYAAIGDELDVPARHVASILAREDDRVPWHRVLAEDGRLSPRRWAEQAARLEAEGVPVASTGVEDLEERFVRVPLDAEHRADDRTPLERRPE